MAGARGAIRTSGKDGRRLSRRLGPHIPVPVAARRNAPRPRLPTTCCFPFAETASGPPRLSCARFDLHNAVYFGLFMGLVAFSTTTALLLMRERRRAARAERRLCATRLAALRGADDLAALLMGSERQLLVSWHGRDGEPRFEGDPTIVGESAPAQRALAFGTWLGPADAAAVGERPRAAQAARRGLSPDRAHASATASSTWRAAPSAGARSCACAT